MFFFVCGSFLRWRVRGCRRGERNEIVRREPLLLEMMHLLYTNYGENVVKVVPKAGCEVACPDHTKVNLSSVRDHSYIAVCPCANDTRSCSAALSPARKNHEHGDYGESSIIMHWAGSLCTFQDIGPQGQEGQNRAQTRKPESEIVRGVQGVQRVRYGLLKERRKEGKRGRRQLCGK